MKKSEFKSVIILIFIILLFILFFICYTLLETIEDQSEDTYTNINEQNILTEETVEGSEEDKIKNILKKYESIYLRKEGPSIYVDFARDLFEKNGNSNRNYFQKIIDELIPFFETESFYLIDNNQQIYIFIKYEEKTKEHKIIINEIENFYDNIDGKDYALVEESEIVPRSKFVIQDSYLFSLSVNSFYFDAIKETIGEGIDLENGYTSYLDGTMKLRTVPTGGVRNIVFSKKYDGMITSKISANEELKKIKEIEPDNAFGSLSEGYLGYREDNFYVFFYENETSFYPYSYQNNKTFESILKDYIEDRNLEYFVKNLKSRWLAYDHFEYDLENNSADILYSTRGVHIKINNNNSRGITLYSNYYFTDYTESLVKKGIIDFEPGVDLVEKTDLERRKNN